MPALSHASTAALRAPPARTRILPWTLGAGFVLVLFSVLGVRTLVAPDEGRYAEMAREMFVSKDWITPRLNGIKYFEKPPLQTWMTALSFQLFGVGEWQARLWSCLAGLAGVGMTGWTARRLYGPRVGLYAAAVLGSSLYWVACSQISSLDMGLAGMTTLALCCLLLAQRDGAAPAERHCWMLACWAAMALAVLSKGLVGIVLPAGALACHALAMRDPLAWRRLYPVSGGLLFLAIAAPWFVLVWMHNPEHPRFFFIHEHVERFLFKAHRREAPWWFFLALLAAGSIPWLGVLPHSLAAVRRGAGRFQPRVLLLAWVLFVLGFFSASSSKLPGYILPLFPALALLIALFLAEAGRRHLAAGAAVLCLLGLLLLVSGTMLGRLKIRAGEAAAYAACQPWMVGAGLVALAGGALGLYCALRMRRDGVVLALAAAGFVSVQLLLAGYEPIGRLRAGTALVPAMRAELRADSIVYSVGTYEQSLSFYLQRTVVLVNYRDEFDFGLRQEPGLAIASIAEFERRWRQNRPALAIVSASVLRELRNRHLPLRLVASDARRSIIANR